MVIMVQKYMYMCILMYGRGVLSSLLLLLLKVVYDMSQTVSKEPSCS